MPWRTLIEAGQHLIDQGMKVEIISISKEKQTTDFKIGRLQVKVLTNRLSSTVDYINENNFDAFLFQVKWRDGLKNLRVLGNLTCRKIAYFDGGVYHLRNIMALINAAGLKISKPFLLDWLTPKSLIIGKLKKYGFNDVVGLSAYTTDHIRHFGFKTAKTIYPGNDFPVARSSEQFDKAKSKYFLFAGSPHFSRGSITLLQAFDLFAAMVSDANIIFLMRKDVGADFRAFETKFDTLFSKSKITIIRQNLQPPELLNYFKNARSVILPFLSIPSEIPLTFFEVLSTGTPVITFANGGTTRYLSPALAISKNLSARSLSKTMYKVWTDDRYYSMLSKNATAIMQTHPTWDQTRAEWSKLITGL